MIEAFEKGFDIHQITASNIFNVPLESVDNKMRKLAKTLNFGIAYGMGPRSLAQQSGLTMEEAKKFIKEYFDDFSSIKKWQEQVISKAKHDGFVENLNGRIRPLPEITSFNQRFQAEAERMAINFPIQSLAADIIKLAMIKTKEKLVEAGFWGTKAKMLLTIHDELVFEIKDDADLKKIVTIIKENMESVYKLSVPLTVNEGIGENWMET
jgi:DNA polymerase-1